MTHPDVENVADRAARHASYTWVILECCYEYCHKDLDCAEFVVDTLLKTSAIPGVSDDSTKRMAFYTSTDEAFRKIDYGDYDVLITDLMMLNGKNI